MRFGSLCACLALLFPFFVHAKDKKQMPKLIVNATYVMVTSYSGEGTADVRVLPEERRAVADVEHAIRQWGRYKLALRRRDADLIIVVRTGRIGTVAAGHHVPFEPQFPTETAGTRGRGEISDLRDMLAVFQPGERIDGSIPLWQSFQADGLDGPNVPLLEEFRKQVEEAAKP